MPSLYRCENNQMLEKRNNLENEKRGGEKPPPPKPPKKKKLNFKTCKKNTINSLNGSYTWTQNASDKESWKRAFRGALGAEFINVEDENSRSNAMAWRPVLELIK